MAPERIQLTSAQRSLDRYYLIKDGKGMGGHGEPPEHYLNQWVVANGVDRGDGFQGYYSVNYALTLDELPDEAKKLIQERTGATKE